MVTKEQFYKVQAVLDGKNLNPNKAPKYTRDNKDFPLRRIVCCSKCGTPFTGAWSKHHQYAYYFCRKRCVYVSVPAGDAHRDLLELLNRIKPSQQGIDMYCKLLLKTYTQHLKRLNSKKRTCDEEIKKLQGLRQVLVEKNLAGIYSDEIFKEQNLFIEEKLTAAYEAQSNELIDKYDINAIIGFLQNKLANLAKTFSTSNITQLQFLLSTIFMSGFSWGYPGISYQGFSPIYQAIHDAGDPGIKVGCGTWTRTKINGFRVRCTTIIRSRNMDLEIISII